MELKRSILRSLVILSVGCVFLLLSWCAVSAGSEEEGLSLLAAGKPADALARFAALDDKDWFRKAGLICTAAGDLRVEDPKPWLRRAEALLQKGLETQPENEEAGQLLGQLRLVRQAIEYVELRGYEESNRKTGIYFTDRLKKADKMLESLPLDSPFADLASLWRGRIHYWFGREGAYESESELARGLLVPLKTKYPDHRIIRMYTGEKVPALTEYRLDVPEGAPEWAVKAREGLVRATDVFRWWVENRQVENGEMGGTYGDDCEMLRAWPVALLAGDDDVVRTGWRRIARGVWENGSIYRGYLRYVGDVEHAAEDISDTQPAMIGLDYGNPIFVQRCLMPMKQMRDVWTAVNPAGHRHFRSHVFSATEIRSRPEDDTDVCYSARAAQTGIWAGWYTRNPALIQLFREYAGAWIAHLDRTEAGKPAGVIPGNIRFATDRTGEYVPWHQGYCGIDYEAMNLMYELIFAAYAMTGDREIERGITEPLSYCSRELLKAGGEANQTADMVMSRVRPAAEKWRVFTGKTDFDPLLRRYGSAYMRWLLSDDRGDKTALVESCSDVIETTKYNLEMVTSEVLFTDRVAVEHPDYVTSMYTGHVGLATYFPVYAVSWEDIGRDVAALVCENRTDSVKLLAYNFNEKPRTVGLRFWRLSPGEYIRRLGTDSDGNDEIDRLLEAGKLRVRERGERLKLCLPPRQVAVLEIRQSTADQVLSELPDIAVAAEEVAVYPPEPSSEEPADIFIPIHNLGPAPAEKAAVTIRVEQGGTSRLSIRRISLPASSDLEPVYQVIHARIPLPAGTSRLKVSASFNGNEITRRNNACETAVTTSVRRGQPLPVLPDKLLRDAECCDLLWRFARLEARGCESPVPVSLVSDLIADIRSVSSNQPSDFCKAWVPVLHRLDRMRVSGMGLTR